MPNDYTASEERDSQGIDDPLEHGCENEPAGSANRCKKGLTPGSVNDDRPGYRRPPKTHRFKPGQSGNPKGRAKGAKGMKSILLKEFNERVRITAKDGSTRTISKMELMVKRLAEKGAKGDYKSITKLIDLGMAVFGMEDDTNLSPSLTRDEQAIIDQAIKRRRALAGSISRSKTPDPKLKPEAPRKARKGDDK